MLSGNFPGGKLSWWGVVLVGSCPGKGGIVLVGVVLMGNCPSGEFS